MNSLKQKQSEIQRLAWKVEVTREDSKGRPVAWRVPCNRTCGGLADWHGVTVNRDTNYFSCDCPGGWFVCRHILAVWAFEVLGKKLRTVSLWPDLPAAERQHRPAYRVKARLNDVYITTRRCPEAEYEAMVV